jgi:hypothetical protein
MDHIRQRAIEQGISAPPDGVSWNMHVYNLQGAERERCIRFLQSIPSVSSPEEDAIRDEIRLALLKLPENPTEEDYERVGLHFTPIEESEKDVFPVKD